MTIQTPTGATRFERPGELGILNVGQGDTKLSFDKQKPAERERAAAIVTDMLRRGFAILVQVGEKAGKPLYMRAESFDPETCEYLIVGLPESTAEPETEARQSTDREVVKNRRGRKAGRVDASATHATAIARSAGG